MEVSRDEQLPYKLVATVVTPAVSTPASSFPFGVQFLNVLNGYTSIYAGSPTYQGQNIELDFCALMPPV